MNRPEYLELWTKIQQFSIDDDTATVRFSDKLASEQGWQAAFTAKTIEEYKKFILLCCISPTGAAPSKIVDEVWHLHLTYTQSYWTDFCKDTLGKEIHHFPSGGGKAEDDKHREWYAATLDLYRETFDKQPPPDIWPDPLTQGVQLELPPRQLRIEIIMAIVLILLFPFLFMYFDYDTFSPFLLGGPHFIMFFLLYSAALMLAYALYRYLDNKLVAQIASANFPEDITPFQLAAFLYGRDRAFQTSLVDMVKKGVLEVREDQRFVIRNQNYQPQPDEQNPLASALAAEKDGSDYSYKELRKKWMDQKKFSHPMLAALEKYAYGKRGHLRDYAFQAAFWIMAIARFIQGLQNHRPVGFLILEAGTLFMIFAFIIRLNSRRAMVCKIIDNLYLGRLKDQNQNIDLVVGEFALAGVPAISGFAEGVLMANIFGAFTSTGYRSTWGGWVIGTGNCGSGSSCGGGGGGCGGGGGGCGGCGGGH